MSLTSDSSTSLLTTVAHTLGAIGYITMLTPTVKALRLNLSRVGYLKREQARRQINLLR